MALQKLLIVLFACYSCPFFLFAQTPPPAQPEGNLKTRWAEEVSSRNVLPEYPRPQMVRENWVNLNGSWDYAIRPVDMGIPSKYDGKILVPFAVESSLSGVKKWVGHTNALWYRTSIRKPFMELDQRLLLHFGAVDWHATIYIDGDSVGSHKGGYDPFTFDITEATKRGKNHELVIKVWDPTDSDHQARGKQVRNPKGIWYTSVTGIWQTVWMEVVNETYVTRIKLTPDIDKGMVLMELFFNEAPGRVTIITEVETNLPPASVSRRNANLTEPVFQTELSVRDPRLWSPDSPFLYDLRVRVKKDNETLDKIESYFGMRKISLGKDDRGFTRLFLNNEPYFQFGTLDQGWWPDGLYTAPTDEALKYDLEVLKDMGFNMLRKHVKVAPDRLYYHCDQIGLLVWQDMPSGFATGYLQVRPEDPNDAERPITSAQQFEQELKAMMDYLHSHPSIVAWVPFNEGWGQYEAQRINAWVKKYDPSRLSNPTSGWTDRGVGDIYDAHLYPGPGMEMPTANRATVLGEYGGLGLPVAGHLWWNKRNWGYRTYDSKAVLHQNYRTLIDGMKGLMSMGLSGAIYTQTSDVEGEVNGLMTYDREVLKFDPATMRNLAEELYEFQGKANVWLPSSEHQPQLWEYSEQLPSTDWNTRGIEQAKWKMGNAPFRLGENPFIPVGTPWIPSELWLRRSFQLEKLPSDLRAMVYCSRDAVAEVYLNSRLLVKLENSRGGRHYTHLDLTAYANLLVEGENLISVKLNSTAAERCFDIGLYSIE